jgi:hypothetical protein
VNYLKAMQTGLLSDFTSLMAALAVQGYGGTGRGRNRHLNDIQVAFVERHRARHIGDGHAD